MKARLLGFDLSEDEARIPERELKVLHLRLNFGFVDRNPGKGVESGRGTGSEGSPADLGIPERELKAKMDLRLAMDEVTGIPERELKVLLISALHGNST